MPASEYLHASGIKVHAGEEGLLYRGTGRIYCSKASLRGIDSHLFAVLKMAVDQLHLSINVNSVDTGEHAKNSRHYRGMAVDINKVISVGPGEPEWEQATLANKAAMKLFYWLRSAGFCVGERVEGRSVPGLIFGPTHSRYNPTSISHDTHLHVSVCS